MRLPITPTSGSKSTNPMVCCCCPQGQTSLKADFSTNAVRPGDRVMVKV